MISEMAESVTLPAEEYAQLRALLDRQQIEACLARIARGTDRFDRALFLSGCHADAQFSVGGQVSSAEDTYEGGRAMHAEGTIATLHCLSTMTCDIAGDEAHVETYHLYCARAADETNWAATGRYLDRFEKRSGVWGLVFRHISVEWAGKLSPMDFDLLVPPGAPRHALSASRDSQDVSYRRPLHG
jgi:hypothetical protein